MGIHVQRPQPYNIVSNAIQFAVTGSFFTQIVAYVEVFHTSPKDGDPRDSVIVPRDLIRVPRAL